MTKYRKHNHNRHNEFNVSITNIGFNQRIGYNEDEVFKENFSFGLEFAKNKNREIAERCERLVRFQLYKEFIKRLQDNNIKRYWFDITSRHSYMTTYLYMDDNDFVTLTIFITFQITLKINQHDTNRLKLSDPEFYDLLWEQNRIRNTITQEYPSLDVLIENRKTKS
ncbi:hypothetical protein PBI_SCTP2_341 [Salicola phage SCTP-2]|nr:hypothetical protein PBI_SCTP2_341 [Salicola phage SCTP-2]